LQSQDNNCDVYLIDLSAIKLRVSSNTPLLIYSKHLQTKPNTQEILDDVATAILQIETTLDESISILIIELDDPEFLSASSKRSFSDLLILGLQDIEILNNASSLNEQLLAFMRKKLDLSILSPYQTSRPANKAMFFGRNKEVQQLLRREKTSFAVWGMRKIGKTSLLTEVRRRYIEDRHLPPEKVVYVDCGDLASSFDYYKEVSLPVVGEKRANNMTPSDFASFLRSFSNDGKSPVTYILDEIDHLILADIMEGRGLQKLIRSSYKSGYCRYIISGFFDARQERQRIESPLYNFTEDIDLRGLSLEESKNLITQPMRELGIKLAPVIVDEIYTESRGQPAIIQMICRKIIDTVADSQSRIEIGEEELRQALMDPTINDMELELFFLNTTPLEKAIIYSNIQKDSFGISDVKVIFNKELGLFPPIDEIRTALKYLEYIGVMSKIGEKYRFPSMRLSTLLRNTQDVKYLLECEIAEGNLRFKYPHRSNH
jgi:hypothetical protein